MCLCGFWIDFEGTALRTKRHHACGPQVNTCGPQEDLAARKLVLADPQSIHHACGPHGTICGPQDVLAARKERLAVRKHSKSGILTEGQFFFSFPPLSISLSLFLSLCYPANRAPVPVPAAALAADRRCRHRRPRAPASVPDRRRPLRTRAVPASSSQAEADAAQIRRDPPTRAPPPLPTTSRDPAPPSHRTAEIRRRSAICRIKFSRDPCGPQPLLADPQAHLAPRNCTAHPASPVRKH